MLRFKRVPQIAVVMIALMLVMTCFQGEVSAQTEDIDQVVVLFDQTHLNQFTADDETHGLKLMLDMVNASTKYIVRVNIGDPLNETILSDVDILIIAEPDSSAEFQEDEVSAIAEFLANGSSLLVLGGPTIAQNSTYWIEQPFRDTGDNLALNNFFDAINMTSVRFSVNETADGTIRADTMFDYEHALNASIPWVLELDSTTWDTTHPIFNDINSLITMVGTLKPIDVPSAIATGYDTSFAQYRRGPNTWANSSFPNMTLAEFEEKPLSYSAINGTFPPWMAVFEFDESRVIVAGSTIMFSGRNLDFPETNSLSELQWFYQADNSRLFMNMLNWLSQDFVESPSAIVPMAIISSAILIVGVAVYLFRKIR